mmetsp:Transcript_607/g.756  ORF Transcript_607/g.756 Transcript_607/m.756 type:complete len:135 (+) Transcript_607:987-1391(+)
MPWTSMEILCMTDAIARRQRASANFALCPMTRFASTAAMEGAAAIEGFANASLAGTDLIARGGGLACQRSTKNVRTCQKFNKNPIFLFALFSLFLFFLSLPGTPSLALLPNPSFSPHPSQLPNHLPSPSNPLPS